jgi:hypothetical protein
VREDKFCRYCGAKIRIDSEFCEKCGKQLTPQKEIATPPSAKVRARKVSRTRVLLVVLVIALASTNLVAWSTVPNPLIKNRPWVTMEWVTISSLRIYGTTFVDFGLAISIHNPTHRNYHIEMNRAVLDANIASGSLEKHLRYSTNSSEIFQNGQWTFADSIELQACYPIIVGFEFLDTPTGIPSPVDKGTFHLNLAVTINGTETIFSSDLSQDFVTTPTAGGNVLTITITTSTQLNYKRPNECLLPWL